DDCLSKPLNRFELMARIRTVLRRHVSHTQDAPAHILQIGDLTIDLEGYQISRQSRPVQLPRREFELLRFLVTHPDQTFSRQTLLDRVWGDDVYVTERTVDVHMRRLRLKIEKDISHPIYLVTVHGIGYKWRSVPETP